MRQTALKSIYKIAQKNDKIIFIGSDLGPKVMDDFKRDFPDRFFMDGAAEQHLISMASGMALEGYIPYVNTISTFLTRRCYEQIFINCGLQNLKVRLVGNGGGVVYAPLGGTHTAVDDINLLRGIPNMSVFVPSDANEMKKIILATENHNGPIYIRIARGHEKIVTDKLYKKFKIGNIYSFDKKKCNTAIFSTGITYQIALEIQKKLFSKKIKVNVYNMPSIKPLNINQLTKILNFTKNIFSIEEHSIVGGIGTILSEVIAEKKIYLKVFKKFALPDEPLKGYGRQHEMMKKYNLDQKNLIRIILKQINKK